MAAIREVLTLEDQFSAAFTQYIRLGTDAAASTREVREAATRATAASRIQGAAMNAAVSSARAQATAYRTSAAQSRAQAEASRAAAAASRAQTEELRRQRAEQDLLKQSTGGLISEVKRLAGAYLGMRTVTGLVNLSDTMTQTKARLDMMNDGRQDTAELQQMIYESAQRSRGSYQGTAELVSKLGTLAGNAFNSSAEIVDFAEQINKQIALSGASTQAADAALLQLTQAMSSGVLRGEELNSILEQTPTIAQSIAKYMGVTTGQMREMASEGQVTAEVVKNAMFDAAEKTNEKFEKIPMTWGQVWTSVQNTAIMATQPVLDAINWTANNLDLLIPIVGTAGAAFLVFVTAANWVNICTGATNTLANAQKMLKAFMATTWGPPLLAIVLVIGAVYMLVAAYNALTGESVSATGIIAGAFLSLGAFVINGTVIPMINMFSAFGNFLMNFANDPVAAIKILFYDMATTVLGYISNVAHGIENLVNAIPGVEVSITGGIDSLYNQVKSASQTAKDKAGWVEYFKTYDNIDLNAAFNTGYNWGSNLFSGGSFGNVGGYSAAAAQIPTYDQMADLKESVGSIEKSVSMSEEDLKSLVDMAERRYVNRINLTSQTPTIIVNGQNTGNTAADRQSLADTIRDILLEQVAAGSTRNTAY